MFSSFTFKNLLKIQIHFQISSVCVGKIALFGEASVLAWARGALPMCAMCGGVSSFFVRGEKKQNKFPSNCTALSTEYQSNLSVFCD